MCSRYNVPPVKILKFRRHCLGYKSRDKSVSLENANSQQLWSLPVLVTDFESWFSLLSSKRDENVAPDSVVFGRIFPIRLQNVGYKFVTRLCPKSYNFREYHRCDRRNLRLIEGLNFRVNIVPPDILLANFHRLWPLHLIYIYIYKDNPERKGYPAVIA